MNLYERKASEIKDPGSQRAAVSLSLSYEFTVKNGQLGESGILMQ